MGEKYTPVGRQVIDPEIRDYRADYYDPIKPTSGSSVNCVIEQLDILMSGREYGRFYEADKELRNHRFSQDYVEPISVKGQERLLFTEFISDHYVFDRKDKLLVQELYRFSLRVFTQETAPLWSESYEITTYAGGVACMGLQQTSDLYCEFFHLEGERQGAERSWLAASEFDIEQIIGKLSKLEKAPTQVSYQI